MERKYGVYYKDAEPIIGGTPLGRKSYYKIYFVFSNTNSYVSGTTDYTVHKKKGYFLIKRKGITITSRKTREDAINHAIKLAKEEYGE